MLKARCVEISLGKFFRIGILFVGNCSNTWGFVAKGGQKRMMHTEFKRKIISILTEDGYCITSTWTNQEILEALIRLIQEKEMGVHKSQVGEDPSGFVTQQIQRVM